MIEKDRYFILKFSLAISKEMESDNIFYIKLKKICIISYRALPLYFLKLSSLK